MIMKLEKSFSSHPLFLSLFSYFFDFFKVIFDNQQQRMSQASVCVKECAVLDGFL